MTTDCERNMPPYGWQRCLLPDFTCIVMGQSPSSTTYNHRGDGIPFFQGNAEFGDLYPTLNMYCSQPNKIARKGATLLSIRARVGPTNLAQYECCIGRGLAALHPCGKIDPKFLLYRFRSIEPVISGKGTGSTFKAITKGLSLKALNSTCLRWPNNAASLPRSRNSSLNSTKVSRASKRRARNSASTAKLCSKHAFEGKVTAKWREENKDKLETPEQLLARIKQERAAHYDQQLEEWKAAVKEWEENGKLGKKPPKLKKLQKVVDLPHIVTEKLPPLPESCMWATLGWMTCGVEYGSAAKSAPAGKVPVLRMGNVRNAKFDWSDLVYTSDDHEIATYLLRDGDILFNRTNSPELVGKTAIYIGNRPAVFAGYLIRINHIPTVVRRPILESVSQFTHCATIWKQR